MLAPVLAAALLLYPAATDAQRVSPRNAEHDEAHEMHRIGQFRSLGEQLSAASRVGRGQHVGTETDIRRSLSRFTFLRPDGTVVRVDVDMRTASVVRVH